MRERKKRGGREPYEPKPPEGVALDHLEVLQRFRERKEKAGLKQLNVWIKGDTISGVKEKAKNEERTVASVVEEILSKSLSETEKQGVPRHIKDNLPQDTATMKTEGDVSDLGKIGTKIGID